MKTISITCLVFLFLLTGLRSTAQSHTIDASTGELHLIEVKRLSLVGHNANKIVIEVQGDLEEAPARAEGLRPINAKGYADNTGIGLSVTKEDDTYTVHQLSSQAKNKYTVKVPQGVSVFVESSAMNAGKLIVQNVTSEIDANVHWGAVELSGVTGPLAIHSVYGSINANFDAISQDGSISLYSVYSFVDVTVPETGKADFMLDTDYGEVFSDLDLTYPKDKDGYRNLTGGKQAAKWNGGGIDFSLKSAYNNVYLRKK